MDFSNGYQEHAFEFIRLRSSQTNVPQVRQWLQNFKGSCKLLDLGCGTGFPITCELLDAGHQVSAIDASSTMVERLSKNYPDVVVFHEAVESSKVFAQKFDGIIAVGLIFLLNEAGQIALLEKIAASLRPRGRFMFTAPLERGTWIDVITKSKSVSLGRHVYESQLQSAGMILLENFVDAQGNNHYSCQKS